VNKFLWLMRRELWESRVVWLAPAVVAVAIVGFALLSVILTGHLHFEGIEQETLTGLHDQLTPAKLDALATVALVGLTVPFVLLVGVTQFLYAVDALYGERRDRSILFWKSMPVSDLQTVLAKAALALLVLPAAAFAAAVVTEIAIFLIASATLSGAPMLISHLWSPGVWLDYLLASLTLLAGGVLWYLPLVGFTLLLSALVPRSPIYYAVLLPLGAVLLEYLTFHTRHLGAVLADREVGLFPRLLRHQGHGDGFGLEFGKHTVPLPHGLVENLDVPGFLASPDLWIGVLVGAALLAAAAWVRRYRDAAG
jgi:ABC-2 type transport system permease protein